MLFDYTSQQYKHLPGLKKKYQWLFPVSLFLYPYFINPYLLMKYFIFLYFCSLQLLSKAQYPASMDNYTVADRSPVNFTNPKHKVRFEVPPWTIAGGWHTYIMVNGNACFTYSTPGNMITDNIIDLKNYAPNFAVGPEGAKPWKRSYSSIYSAHFFAHPVEGNINIGFCHNENTNACHHKNTINPLIEPLCGTAMDYTAYFAMVSAVWTPSNKQTNWGQKGYDNDLGPILWPSLGFVTSDNINASEGLMQPSSIINGNYIYIFIWDKGPLGNHKGQEGKSRGIKLVRTTITNCTNPALYEVYYKDPAGLIHWLPSLPKGFTKETLLQFVKVPGPKATDILTDEIPNNTEAFRFTAARVKNHTYFIGCEEYIDNNDQKRHHIALRFSYNLIDWSKRKKIVETSTNWNASDMNYPIFVSADGWSNTEVDLDDFYLVGTHSQSPFNGVINRLHIKIKPGL